MNREPAVTRYSPSERTVCSGCAIAISQHGEIFQGVTHDGDGRLHRCLVSLPCRSLRSKATFVPEPLVPLKVVPKHKHKALKAAEIVLESLGACTLGGVLRIESNIIEGKGLGSSTADCTAAVLAIADAFKETLTTEHVAELVVRAEIASGNMMFDTSVLFAHREGKVLDHYHAPVPSMTVLGFDTEEDKIVETLRFPPAIYTAQDIEMFDVLATALRRAVQTNDLQLLGKVSTASAQINQRFLPKPFFEEMCDAVKKIGALGIAVAHSGTVAGILLDGNTADCEGKIEQVRIMLESLGIREVMQFET